MLAYQYVECGFNTFCRNGADKNARDMGQIFELEFYIAFSPDSIIVTLIVAMPFLFYNTKNAKRCPRVFTRRRTQDKTKSMSGDMLFVMIIGTAVPIRNVVTSRNC